MELRHLRYFVVVAETLNFSRAALRLHITQPALSRQIRDLEGELACRLLHRGPNARTELTAEGRLLLVGAREIIAMADKLGATVRVRAERLRLGHYGVLWLDYFSAALRKFARLHPRTVIEPVELTPRELAGSLRREEIDVALIGLADLAMRREFKVRTVAEVPGRLALGVAHPLAKRRRLRLDELREANWVTWDEHEFPGRKKVLVEACRQAGFRPRIVAETDSMASLFVQVASNGVVGQVIPMAANLPHAGVVLTELDPPTAIVSRMDAAWRKHEPRAALIEKLVDGLCATRS